MTLPDGFYAVPDPDEPGDVMTFWRVRYGGISAYPKNAKYGPLMPRENAPVGPEERAVWIQGLMDYRQLWNAHVLEAIESYQLAARRRFAEHTGRCCVCARPLANGRSRLLGIGDRCRERMPHDLLMAYLAEVKRSQALPTREDR